MALMVSALWPMRFNSVAKIKALKAPLTLFFFFFASFSFCFFELFSNAFKVFDEIPVQGRSRMGQNCKAEWGLSPCTTSSQLLLLLLAFLLHLRRLNLSNFRRFKSLSRPVVTTTPPLQLLFSAPAAVVSLPSFSQLQHCKSRTFTGVDELDTILFSITDSYPFLAMSCITL